MQGQLGPLGKAEYPNADGGVFIDMNIGDAAAQHVHVMTETWAEQTVTSLTACGRTCAPLVSTACSESLPLWGMLPTGPATGA